MRHSRTGHAMKIETGRWLAQDYRCAFAEYESNTKLTCFPFQCLLETLWNAQASVIYCKLNFTYWQSIVFAPKNKTAWGCNRNWLSKYACRRFASEHVRIEGKGKTFQKYHKRRENLFHSGANPEKNFGWGDTFLSMSVMTLFHQTPWRRPKNGVCTYKLDTKNLM